MSVADEVRAATARGVLHPLVAKNQASPRGLCMGVADRTDGVAFCLLDYGHAGGCWNDRGASRELERLRASLEEWFDP